MIAFVKGILDSVSEDKIIVENQNIGFEILVPGSVVSELPQVGNTVEIYTYRSEERRVGKECRSRWSPYH